MTDSDQAGLDEPKRRLRRLDAERAELEARIRALESQPLAPVRRKDLVVLDVAVSATSIDQHASPPEKIALFRRLFRGRKDVFPLRWENRSSGRSGYAPACANEWKPGICGKPQVKCMACPHKAFIPVTDCSATIWVRRVST